MNDIAVHHTCFRHEQCRPLYSILCWCWETSDDSFYFHFSLKVRHAEHYIIRAHHLIVCVFLLVHIVLKVHLYIRDNCLLFHPVGLRQYVIICYHLSFKIKVEVLLFAYQRHVCSFSWNKVDTKYPLIVDLYSYLSWCSNENSCQGLQLRIVQNIGPHSQ